MVDTPHMMKSQFPLGIAPSWVRWARSDMVRAIPDKAKMCKKARLMTREMTFSSTTRSWFLLG
eukprot:CAMPEP_0173307068 /NCGR_PEP_ID=MMETSP1143-20121109/20933_1 /TAXON_ID=483371 /ORGANISM="non described non described, Strain CCMP2298" /LENGTH=62 /DNA_ID=CAMNT_0014248235 /DNA_START=379 /DNA_END=564 /DNA_ORIENTATION=+